jgi:hypothetical protein
MLRSLKELERYTVTATDGDVGTVVNFLFDDERWAIRHLVVETGDFFNERRVLISPISFRDVDWAMRTFRLALTKDKVKNSPSVDVDQPVSRQHEREYYQYYGYPYYWGYMGEGAWGAGCYPALLWSVPAPGAASENADHVPGAAHLRSAKEVRGYHIQGSDDSIGFVEDFIVDDETWEVRYMVVDTSHWWWGRKVLVAPHWTSRVSWAERKVIVNLTREAIKRGPSWEPNSVIRRDYEARLHDYTTASVGIGARPQRKRSHATKREAIRGEGTRPGASATATADELERKGFRVLAVAVGATTLKLAGIIALSDPPRPGAVNLIKELKVWACARSWSPVTRWRRRRSLRTKWDWRAPSVRQDRSPPACVRNRTPSDAWINDPQDWARTRIGLRGLSDEDHHGPRSDDVVRRLERKLGTGLSDIQRTLEGRVDGAFPSAAFAGSLLHGEPQRLRARANHHIDVRILLRPAVEVIRDAP